MLTLLAFFALQLLEAVALPDSLAGAVRVEHADTFIVDGGGAGGDAGIFIFQPTGSQGSGRNLILTCADRPLS